jgi:hypothetical protein
MLLYNKTYLAWKKIVVVFSCALLNEVFLIKLSKLSVKRFSATEASVFPICIMLIHKFRATDQKGLFFFAGPGRKQMWLYWQWKSDN